MKNKWCLDSPKKTAIYEELNEIAAELAPAVHVIEKSCLILYHPWVKNYVNSEFHYAKEQYLDIDVAVKKSLNK